MNILYKLDNNEIIVTGSENISFFAGKRNQQNNLRTVLPSVKTCPETNTCLKKK